MINAALGSALVIVALLSVLIAPVAFARLHPQVPGAAPVAAHGGAKEINDESAD